MIEERGKRKEEGDSPDLGSRRVAVPAEEPLRESEMIVAMFRTAFILMVVFSPTLARAMAGYTLRWHLSVVLACLYSLGLVVMYWRHYESRGHRYLIVLLDLGLITIWIWLSGAGGGHFFPFYYLVIIVAGLWFGVFGTLVTAAIATGLYVMVLAHTAPDLAQALSKALDEQIPYLFLVALIIGYLADAQRRERDRWAETKAFLTRYQERVRLSESIYDLHIPQQLMEIPGLDLGLAFRPALRMGAGDYYEIRPLGNNRYGICIADVAGKYTPGVIKVPLFKGFFRAGADVYQRPAQVLTKINEWIYPDLQPDYFISMCYVVIDLERRELAMASAGHEPPILVKAQTKQAMTLTSEDLVLGIYPDTSYQEQVISLDAGDTLAFYTDGVSGASNAQKEEFGEDRIESGVLAGTGLDLPAQELAEGLFDMVNRFAQGGQRRDDITILVVRVKKFQKIVDK